MSEDDFRGRGWRFPPVPGPGGGLGYVDGDAGVDQSVRLLLRTAAGERSMRPEFGSTAGSLVFLTDSEQNLADLRRAVGDALRRFEPRVEVDAVETTRHPSVPGRVDVGVTYRVLRTNTRRNLVFPFHLRAEVEP